MGMLNKCLKGFFLLVLLVFIFILANTGFAGTMPFPEESASYRAGAFDDERSCEALAFLQVKRQLFANLGAYLQREPKLKKDQNLSLTQDEIFILQFTKDDFIALMACLVRPEVVDHNWDGQQYFLKARIRADPDEVKISIKKLYQDKQKTKELDETRRKADDALRTADEALKTVEELKGLTIAEAEKKERAKSRYRAAIDKVGATDWFERACISITAGKKDAALHEYTNAINFDRGYAQAYYCRANVKSDLGKPRYTIKDVMSDYDEAIRADSNYVPALLSRGNAKTDLGQYKDAIPDYERVTQLDRKNMQAFIKCGNAKSKLERYADAIRDYDQVITWLDRKNVQAYIGRGNARSKLGKYADAIRDFDEIITWLDRKNVPAYNGRGIARTNDGKHWDAIRDFDEALRLEPKNVQAYTGRGIAKNNDRKPRDAIRDFDEAIRIDDKYAEAYYHRGRTYYLLGEKQRGITDGKIAAKLGSIPSKKWLESIGVK